MNQDVPGKRKRLHDDQGRQTPEKRPKIGEREKLRASSSSPKAQYDALRLRRGTEMGSRPVDAAPEHLRHLLERSEQVIKDIWEKADIRLPPNDSGRQEVDMQIEQAMSLSSMEKVVDPFADLLKDLKDKGHTTAEQIKQSNNSRGAENTTDVDQMSETKRQFIKSLLGQANLVKSLYKNLKNSGSDLSSSCNILRRYNKKLRNPEKGYYEEITLELVAESAKTLYISLDKMDIREGEELYTMRECVRQLYTNADLEAAYKGLTG